MTNKEGFTTSIGIYWTSGEWPRPAGTRSSDHAILVLLTDHLPSGSRFRDATGRAEGKTFEGQMRDRGRREMRRIDVRRASPSPCRRHFVRRGLTRGERMDLVASRGISD